MDECYGVNEFYSVDELHAVDEDASSQDSDQSFVPETPPENLPQTSPVITPKRRKRRRVQVRNYLSGRARYVTYLLVPT